MSKLPIISGKECIKALEKKGFTVNRQRGSHVILKKNQSVVVVPMHKTIDRGTLNEIIKQSGITVDELINLL